MVIVYYLPFTSSYNKWYEDREKEREKQGGKKSWECKTLNHSHKLLIKVFHLNNFQSESAGATWSEARAWLRSLSRANSKSYKMKGGRLCLSK